jgi:hypothetical protein
MLPSMDAIFRSLSLGAILRSLDAILPSMDAILRFLDAHLFRLPITPLIHIEDQ